MGAWSWGRWEQWCEIGRESSRVKFRLLNCWRREMVIMKVLWVCLWGSNDEYGFHRNCVYFRETYSLMLYGVYRAAGFLSNINFLIFCYEIKDKAKSPLEPSNQPEIRTWLSIVLVHRVLYNRLTCSSYYGFAMGIFPRAVVTSYDLSS